MLFGNTLSRLYSHYRQMYSKDLHLHLHYVRMQILYFKCSHSSSLNSVFCFDSVDYCSSKQHSMGAYLFPWRVFPFHASLVRSTRSRRREDCSHRWPLDQPTLSTCHRPPTETRPSMDTRNQLDTNHKYHFTSSHIPDYVYNTPTVL